MAWEVEFTNEFGEWWDGLTEGEQEDVAAKVKMLRNTGPNLGRPHADQIETSRHANMKELIVQHAGNPYRVFFAFDPRRTAILLIGGNKVGDNRFYKKMVPIADEIYDQHLLEITQGGTVQ